MYSANRIPEIADDVVLEPDLLVVLDPARIGEQVIDGPVDVVVEILSPGTAARDLGPKRRAYQEGGVREYWIVDPEAGSIEVLSLVDGAYVAPGRIVAVIGCNPRCWRA